MQSQAKGTERSTLENSPFGVRRGSLQTLWSLPYCLEDDYFTHAHASAARANQLAITSRRGYNQQHSGAAIAAAPSRGSATLGEFNEDLRRAATAAERCETEGALSSMSNDETAAADRARAAADYMVAADKGTTAARQQQEQQQIPHQQQEQIIHQQQQQISRQQHSCTSAADDPADVAANDTIPADGNTCDAADTAAAAGDGIGAPSEHMVTVHECSSAAATCTATAAGDDIAAPADGRFTASDATDATEDAGDTAAAAPTSTLTAAAAARENSSQADDSTHVLADDSAPLTAGADKTAAPHAHAGEAPCKAKEHNKTTALTQTASTAAAVADRLVDAGESACQSNSTAAHTLREQVNVALHALSFSAASDVAAATGGAVSAGHAPAEKAASVPSSFENAGGSGSPHEPFSTLSVAEALQQRQQQQLQQQQTPAQEEQLRQSVQQVHHNHPTAPLPPCEDEGRAATAEPPTVTRSGNRARCVPPPSGRGKVVAASPESAAAAALVLAEFAAPAFASGSSFGGCTACSPFLCSVWLEPLPGSPQGGATAAPAAATDGILPVSTAGIPRKLSRPLYSKPAGTDRTARIYEAESGRQQAVRETNNRQVNAATEC
ncbi:AF4/FMR2 family member 4-like [Cyclospora cayetanensis]|uniref:AF4/FMR2 family member 4-like n=1 Tax=Cyclospora cayetanensis TaxID=88456 RepID=A0A6P6S0U0_9EIME|nr:AF4/FMR2 family member 4-like [Cyclospora cayetanensis]